MRIEQGQGSVDKPESFEGPEMEKSNIKWLTARPLPAMAVEGKDGLHFGFPPCIVGYAAELFPDSSDVAFVC